MSIYSTLFLTIQHIVDHPGKIIYASILLGNPASLSFFKKSLCKTFFFPYFPVIPFLDVFLLGTAIWAVPLNKVLFRHPVKFIFLAGRDTANRISLVTRLVKSHHAHFCLFLSCPLPAKPRRKLE